MCADIDPRRMHEIHVVAAAALLARHISLIDLFGDEPIGYFEEEFLGKPIEQAAHLGAGARVLGQQPVPAQGEAARLVEIFGDRPGTARTIWIADEHRRLAGRIADQEILSALEGLSSISSGLWNIAEKQPDETRCGQSG
jgi:hypothetical protein